MCVLTFLEFIVLIFQFETLIQYADGFAMSTTWWDLEQQLGPSFSQKLPVSIDSVSVPSKPDFSKDHPTLFRERHGWCPYSERVWLALELIGIDYDTVRIDNTGGPRPSYFGGQTPQIRWPDGKQQGESMDIVQELDMRHNGGKLYQPKDVQVRINSFRNIFPRARPSSRAAFLFQYNGEPLWKSTFETTLKETNELLSSSMTTGPFFCGKEISAADIAWAPFLERYRYQLPCLHEGLEPDNEKKYPYLAAWYDAMDQISAYACRVKGDAGSWRKVLSMAGFGNAGIPPTIQKNIDLRVKTVEVSLAKESVDLKLWKEYIKTRPYVAESPHAEAAAIIVRNRQALAKDTVKQLTTPSSSYYQKGWWSSVLPSSEKDMDEILRELAAVLMKPVNRNDELSDITCPQQVAGLASFLDVSARLSHCE